MIASNCTLRRNETANTIYRREQEKQEVAQSHS